EGAWLEVRVDDFGAGTRRNGGNGRRAHRVVASGGGARVGFRQLIKRIRRNDDLERANTARAVGQWQGRGKGTRAARRDWTVAGRGRIVKDRSEERRVGKECRMWWVT